MPLSIQHIVVVPNPIMVADTIYALSGGIVYRFDESQHGWIAVTNDVVLTQEVVA